MVFIFKSSYVCVVESHSKDYSDSEKIKHKCRNHKYSYWNVTPLFLYLVPT